MGAEGVNFIAISSVLFALAVIGLWLHFAFVPVEGGTSFMATRTASARQVQATRTVLPTSGFVFRQPDTPTPVPQRLVTSLPSPTPTATVTPTETVDAWATEYWSVELTRQAQFTDRGVLAPATVVCLNCQGTLVATLPPTPTRVWYNTVEPDFTPAILQTRAMDATIQAYIETSATAQAEERSERFSERAPQATRMARERGIAP